MKFQEIIHKKSKWVDKYHYVIWSGGLDSTYLLDQIARIYSTQEQQVYTISFIYPHIDKNKELMEKRARKKYLSYARKKGYNIESFVLNIADAPPMGGRGLKQQILWMLLSLPYVWDNSVMHFGYVRKDDFWHYRHRFDKIAKQIGKIKELSSVEMAYDLEDVDKSNLIGKIPDGMFWYCESPKKIKKRIVPCGTCCCCVTHKVAEYRKSLVDEA